MRSARTLLAVGGLSCCAPLTQAASDSYEQAVLSDAPALYYRFDESSGPVINHGSLGPGFNASISGGVSRSVLSPGTDDAMGFDSADDQISSLSVVPASLTGNPSFTIEAVFKVQNFSTLWAPVLHWGSGTTGKEVYFSFQNNNEDRFYVGFYNAGLRTVGTIPQNTWLHTAWIREGGNNAVQGTRLFINGTLVPMEIDTDLIFSTITPNVTSTVFHINHGSDFTRFFIGAIDELAVYGSALNASDVVDHYRAFAGLPLGDTDGDGDVDDADLGAAFANYTGPVGVLGNKSLAQGDTDGDGDVDDADLGAAFANYTGPLTPAVPEPASATLLSIAGACMTRRRDHRRA